MAQLNQGRLLTDDATMRRLGLDSSKLEIWEDGLRSPNTEAGEFEWWYADAHLQDGWFFQVAFFYNSEPTGSSKFGMIYLNIAKDGKKLCDLQKRVDELPANLHVSKDRCEVRFKKSFFVSVDGLRKFHIYVDPDEMDGFGADVTITRTTPSYRPGAGRWDVDGRHFSWFVAVPGGHLTGEITTANGTKTKVEGNAYHDHNWGNVPMETILDNWLWGRAEVHGMTVVASCVRFREDCGGREVPLLLVMKGDQVLVNAVDDQQATCLEGVKMPQPQTGKQTSTDCILIAKPSTEDGVVQVRLNGQRRVVSSFAFPTESETWETWYTRYSGLVTVTIIDGEKRVCASDHGTLEVMDFMGRKKM